MSLARLVGCLVFLSFCASTLLPAHSRRITVTGKLTQLASTGSDSEGAWALQLNPVITVDGRQLSNLEIRTPHRQKLEPLQDEFVQATGILTITNSGSSAPVLKLSSVHSVKYNNPDADKSKASFWSSVVNFFSLSPI